MRRKASKPDLGEAISFDSVLTVLTVLLVLRMIFLIPMVNVDKAKLDTARRDSLWIRAAMRLERTEPSPDESTAPYREAFGLQGCRIVLENDTAGVAHMSALAPDSTFMLLEHDTRRGKFHSLRVQRSNIHPVFRRGTLLWSPAENAWFIVSDTTDYGQDPSSVAFQARARAREEAR